MKSKRSKQSAFTLIELIIVIAIILILAGTLLPVINTSRKDAQIAKATAEVDAIKSASAIYHADTGTWPDSIGNLTVDTGDPNWNGPYIDEAKNDPWNKPYLIYDPAPGSSGIRWVQSYGANATSDNCAPAVCNTTTTPNCDICFKITSKD